MQKDIKILLYTQANVEYDISYITEIPMSLNLLIADVRQPDKRNSTFSKTINLPGTKEINKFFELIWRTNIKLQTLDPNLKCAVYYYINGVEQIKGDLQLLRINVNDETSEVIYECSIVGRLGNLFLAFGDSLLTDLDFSEYDHALTKANVTDSWATQIQVSGSPVPFAYGSGYVYDLRDYGLNNGDVSNLHVKHLRPALYKKTILDKCFALAGYTYTSSYFNSAYYKRLIIPADKSDTFQVSNTYKNNAQFYAGRAGSDSSSSVNLSVQMSGEYSYVGSVLNQMIFNDDTTSPYNDAGGNYNNGTGEITFTNANTFDLTAIVNFELDYNYPSPTPELYSINYTFTYVLYIEKFISGVWVVVATSTKFKPFTTKVAGSPPVQNIKTDIYNLSVTLPNNTVNVGDKFRVRYKLQQSTVEFYDAGTLLSFYSTALVTINNKIGSTFYSNLSSLNIQEGLPVSCNNILPTNTKIIDWFMNEVYLGNLYMEEDKTTDKNIIIEDRDNFYTGELDWTNKRDISKKRIVTPMGELDWKRYDFTYKKDVDVCNSKYFDEFGEVYGTGVYEIQNDFIKAKQKKELIYSATPIEGNYTNGLVIPKLYKIENSVVKPFKSNIRFLYYGGVINLSYGSWTLKSALSGDTTYTTFPFSGDVDNPYNPTISINWDTPKKIYYNYQLATYTDNNLKNRYYDRFINQITDKNSKIELRHYVLNAYDIKRFSFRKVIFDTDAYFIVNAIKDYDVLKGDTQSTPVELLKLTDYDAYTPSIVLNPPPSGTSGSLRLIGESTTTGENNNNFGTTSRISGGSGNYIEAGATGVELTNCTNVTVNSDVTGFIGIGLSDVTITSDNSETFNALDKIIIESGTDGRLLLKNAIVNTTVTVPYSQLYYKATIIDELVTQTTKILINNGSYDLTDENCADPDLAFWAVAGTGEFDLYIISNNNNQFGGSLKFSYLLG